MNALLPVNWIVGIGVALLALLGLQMAAHAVDLGVSVFGWLLFLFAVGFDFFLIKLSYDRRAG